MLFFYSDIKMSESVPNTEIKLNWFERHLNWTLGIASGIAMLALPLLYYLSFIPRFFRTDMVLAVLMLLIIIAAIIWTILRKGRHRGLTAAVFWPFASTVVVAALSQLYDPLGRTLGNVMFSLTLYAGLAINIIVALCLSNKRGRQATQKDTPANLDEPLSDCDTQGKEPAEKAAGPARRAWIFRHLNWSFGILSAAIIIATASCLLRIGSLWAILSLILLVLIFVCMGIWVLLAKGRNPRLMATGLLPMITPWTVLVSLSPAVFRIKDVDLLIFWATFLMGMLMSAITVIVALKRIPATSSS